MDKSEIVGIGEFRQRATELIRAVEEKALSITIARRGTPVAELRPLSSSLSTLVGSVTVLDGVDLTAPASDPSEWTATH
ncbi:MAG TPA: type II toxin-antitoxin system prevent-host-death family antitoxin [Acidimicrobiia bacterium]|nr:type II toxin-antitoxin system prevent-host-death family antitoxin [Acidimicrobiia bacterium]